MISRLRRIEELGRGWITKETILLFGIAIGVRAIVSLVQVTYGVRGFPGLSLSTWNDFYLVYGQWLGYVHNGLMPYRDFYTYKYTPLFLYTLYPFFVAAGAKAASIPIVISDAATAVIVYLIAKRFAGNKTAFAAGLLYAFAPFMLYYEGYLWLSSQPMTFFLILAVFLFKDNKPVLSFASLAVAVMFKQQALFIMPAYLLLYFVKYRTSIPKGIGIFVAIVVVISLPFLIAAPKDYIGSLNYFSVYLGPLEPALPIASGIVNNPVFAPNPLGTCGVQTIPGVYTGMVCGTIANLKEFASSLLLGKIDQIASFLEPLLVALLAPALYVIRKSPNFLQILCIYSMVASLVLFQDFVEPSLAYYFVPVYALIFASITDRRTLVLGIATALLSVLITEGPFQVILPLGYLFALITLQDQSRSPIDSSSSAVFT
jgi:4-amino-4-deoxy-L-arabinose transferase-like glycosyltransferase